MNLQEYCKKKLRIEPKKGLATSQLDDTTDLVQAFSLIERSPFEERKGLLRQVNRLKRKLWYANSTKTTRPN